MRNPAWNRDELILALDVYLDIFPIVPDISLKEIKDLSIVLRNMDTKGFSVRPNFRSPTSVVMKLMNFRSLDPRYAGSGLVAGSVVDREVWDEFYKDPARLKAVVDLIKKDVSSPRENVEEYSYLSEAPEGGIITRRHVTRERNSKLIKDKKRKELKDKGELTCCVCGFNYEKSYGDRGRDFIECHHIKPLHELGETKTKLSDLVLLCANCHRMIHSKNPWLTVKELVSIYKKS